MQHAVDQIGRIERDIFLTLVSAVGKERARTVKVWSRYKIAMDGYEVLVEFNGRYFPMKDLPSDYDPGYIDAFGELIGKILSAV